MALYVPKLIDNELGFVIPKVMKRWVDSNNFLSEEAGLALLNIAKTCMESKVISQLLSLANSSEKSARVKAKIAQCFYILIDRLGNSIVRIKEVGPMIMTLASLLSHASSVVRNDAKKAVRSLGAKLDRPILEKLL